jgi:hypothetical protein
MVLSWPIRMCLSGSSSFPAGRRAGDGDGPKSGDQAWEARGVPAMVT